MIANPPFSLKDWGRDIWENDPWGRTQYGIRRRITTGDYAFVQHMIASMAEGGTSRMAVVCFQQECAYSVGAVPKPERSARALLKADLIEAVIRSGPEPLLRHWPLAGCVVIPPVSNKPSRAEEQGAHHRCAEPASRKGRAQGFLDPEHGEQIVEWFQAFEDVEDRAKVVSLDEIEGRGVDPQHISDYVLPPISARTFRPSPTQSLPSRTQSPRHAPPKTTCELF